MRGVFPTPEGVYTCRHGTINCAGVEKTPAQLTVPCLPGRFIGLGSRYNSPQHGPHSPNLVRLPFLAKYHYILQIQQQGMYNEYFLSEKENRHVRPVVKADTNLFKYHVKNFSSKNPTATPAQYTQEVGNHFSVHALMATLRFYMQYFLNEWCTFRKSFLALITAYTIQGGKSDLL